MAKTAKERTQNSSCADRQGGTCALSSRLTYYLRHLCIRRIHEGGGLRVVLCDLGRHYSVTLTQMAITGGFLSN